MAKLLSGSLPKLLAFVKSAMDGKHAYEMGAKPRLGSDPSTWKLSDCSGYVADALCEAFAATLPEGSVDQHRWCMTNGFECVSYKQAASLKDHRLRIGFIPPKSKKAGHVWLILNGWTIECDGVKGPDRRVWNTLVLTQRVRACYVLTDPLS
jgi:hypothetical protein